jgi:hypothetical protein
VASPPTIGEYGPMENPRTAEFGAAFEDYRRRVKSLIPFVV